MVRWLVVGSGTCGRGLDDDVARPTSAADGGGHRRDGRAALRAGAGPRYRSVGSARMVAGVGCGWSGRRPPGRRERAWPGWSTDTRSASDEPDAGPGRPGPCRSGSAPRWSNHKRQVLLHAAGAAALDLVASAAPLATIGA